MEDHGQNPIDAVQPVMSVEDLIQMRTEVAMYIFLMRLQITFPDW